MNRIAAIRAEHGIKQKDLAAQLGWVASRLSNYEIGSRNPSLDDSRAIITALNELGVECTLDYVFPPRDPKEQAA